MVAEHRLDNLRNGLLLEDAAVGGAGEHPQPGSHGGLVAEVAALVHADAEARDMSAEMPLGAAAQRHFQRNHLAQQVLGLELGLGAEHAELHLLEQAQARRMRHGLEPQIAGRQWGVQEKGLWTGHDDPDHERVGGRAVAPKVIPVALG